MVSSKNTIAKHQKMQLEQMQYLNTAIEVRKARSNNLAFRREILEKQKVNNYSSEYNRIRAHLQDSSIPFESRQNLKSRTELLKSMGARAVTM